MSLVYITGPTGAGKSTLRRELQRRGYAAYDTDEDRIAEHQDRLSGEPIDYPSDPVQRTPEWYARHAFNLSRAKVEVLAEEAKNQTVFLCGAAYNDLELAGLFSKVICLDIDGETAEQRVVSRTTNDYGKSPDELLAVKARHEAIREKYRSFGACLVDAAKPLPDIADEVIRLSAEEQSQ